MMPKAQTTKEQHRLIVLDQNWKLLKGHHWEREKATHKLGEYFGNHVANKGLVCITYKGYLQPDNKNDNPN